ncbi:substrate-binding domain-containing protein [Streptomyces sp. KS 21]|uniref:substrate-binding domain-containing protein n=1 Tax=Streptomyces sp. KS 21 TaxID=2485150 RepID=UPI0014150E02|nr:substrate-binding domain-containing protein [Streptomyces sp. KS 21]
MPSRVCSDHRWANNGAGDQPPLQGISSSGASRHDDRKRLPGLLAACRARRLECAGAGYQAGFRIAELGDVPAVFCANDSTALGPLCARRDSGRSIRGDISVVGFDEIPEAAYFAPPLAAVRQFGELDRRALELLVEELEGGAHARTRVLISPEMVLRRSAGPAGRLESAPADPGLTAASARALRRAGRTLPMPPAVP